MSEYIVIYRRDGDRVCEVDMVDTMEQVLATIDSYKEHSEEEEYNPEYLEVYSLGQQVTIPKYRASYDYDATTLTISTLDGEVVHTENIGGRHCGMALEYYVDYGRIQYTVETYFMDILEEYDLV